MRGGTSVGPVAAALATRQRSLLVLVLMHVPMTTYLVLVGWTGLGVYPPAEHPVPDVLVALALGGLQLRVSLDSAADRVRRERFVFYAGIIVLAVLPTLWIDGPRWFPAFWFVSASGAMVFAGWVRVPAFLVPSVIATYSEARAASSAGTDAVLAFTVYAMLILTLGAGALVAAAQVVRTVRRLFEARHELADLASRAERRRVGRDLHDSLGQSLSAISIKGELALALLAADPDAAALEIHDLAVIAQQTADDIDAVAQDRTAISLADELAGAGRLLRAAGVAPEIDQSVSPVDPDVDRLLGWAAREGTTNLLRHSTATMCRISVRRDGALTLLEIVNDGAGAPSGRRGGLAGLSERVHSVGGFVDAGRFDRDGFRLRVGVPEGAA